MPTAVDDPAHRDQPSAVVRACARLAESRRFDLAIFAVIVANAVVLGLQTYDRVERELGGVLGVLDTVFLSVFVLELAIRLVAYGRRPQDFFRGGWNVFDFVVITAAFVPGLRENATLLRLVRLARIVRVVRLLPDLRILMVAVGRSLPGVASLAVLAVLVLYIYGMVGWVIFDEHNPEAYGTLGDAMLTLFVLLSLEGLPDMVADGLELSGWTTIYYISFVLVAALLLLNILIGVVINSMEEARDIEARREMAQRRAAAAATPGTEDDLEVSVIDRLAAVRTAVEELETEVKAGALRVELERPPPAE
ncbi:MAG: ion transporter [Actinomycetota bacterium]|nr:ion transporter [Actinomycetota bacterium]